MNVHMHTRLASGRTYVDSNVVAVWRKRGLHITMRLAKQLKHGTLLFRRHVEEVRYVTLGYDEDVARAQRVVVVTCIGKSVLQNHVASGTELARRWVRRTGHGVTPRVPVERRTALMLAK